MIAIAGSETSTRRGDRRDPATRAMRDAVAAWFALDPARLAVLDGDTIEQMAVRLEGRRDRHAVVAWSRDPPPLGHPWAG